MKKKWLLCAAASLAVVACQKSNSGSGGTTLTGLSALPAITDRVTGTSFSSISKSFELFPGGELRSLATTGIKMKDWANPFGAGTSWDTAHSRAMCEAGLVEKNAFNDAATADQLMRVVGAIDTGSYDPAPSGPITIQYGSSLDSAPSNLFILTGSLAGAGKLVKMYAVKTGSDITAFRAYVCGGGAGNWSQQAYVDYSVSGTSAVARSMITGTQTFQGTQFQVSGYAKATGTVSGSSWVSKSIALLMRVGGVYDTYDSIVNIDQRSLRAKLKAWAKGSCTHSSVKHDFTAQTVSSVQLLGDSALSTLAFGTGSAKWAGSWDGAPQGNTSSWDGDSALRVTPASGGDFYADVANETLPALPQDTTISIGFNGVTYPSDNTLSVPDAVSNYNWDCTTGGISPTSIDISPTSTQLNADQLAALASASDKYSFGGSTNPAYVDCHAADVN